MLSSRQSAVLGYTYNVDKPYPPDDIATIIIAIPCPKHDNQLERYPAHVRRHRNTRHVGSGKAG